MQKLTFDQHLTLCKAVFEEYYNVYLGEYIPAETVSELLLFGAWDKRMKCKRQTVFLILGNKMRTVDLELLKCPMSEMKFYNAEYGLSDDFYLASGPKEYANSIFKISESKMGLPGGTVLTVKAWLYGEYVPKVS